MRSPTSGVYGQLGTTVTQSGYLVSISMVGESTLYLCSLDVDFTFNSILWVSNSIDISGISWDATGVQQGTMVLGDADLQFWDYALNLVLQDAAVSIWQIYADAPGEAEPLWTGHVGAITKGDLEVQCTLVPDNKVKLTPTRKVQYVIPSKFLAPAGTILYINNQQWVLARQTFN